MSEIVDRCTPIAPTRAYAMRACDDQHAPEIHALIDPGSTHSHICIEQLSDKLPSVEPLAYDMLVTSPPGHSVRVN